MRKRIGALGLTVALIVGLCACAVGTGNKADRKLDPKKPVTITIWHYYNGTQKVAFDHMLDEFNATVGLDQGIVIEGHNQGDVGQLETNVLAAVNKEVGSQAAPDLFSSYADTAYAVEQMGLLADLDEYFSPEELEEYVPSYIEEGRIGKNGELKIFPTAKSTEVMMLNETDWTVFAADTGVTLEDLATKEGLVEVAKVYYEYTDSQTPDIPGDGRAFYGRDAVANLFLTGAKQLGCELFEVNNQELTLHLDKEVIRRIWDVYYSPMIQGYFAAYGRFRSDDAKVGKLIALTGSTSSVSFFPTEVTREDDYSYPIEALVLPVPVFEGGEPWAVQQGAGVAIIKSTPKKEYASTVFLKWFTDPQRNLDFSASSGYLPVKQKAYDRTFLEDLLAQEEMKRSENVKKALRVGFDTVTTQSLYTSKAFANGGNARRVLENSMTAQVEADLEAISKLLEQGKSRQEAARELDTDARFEQWYASFVDEMTKALE